MPPRKLVAGTLAANFFLTPLYLDTIPEHIKKDLGNSHKQVGVAVVTVLFSGSSSAAVNGWVADNVTGNDCDARPLTDRRPAVWATIELASSAPAVYASARDSNNGLTVVWPST